MAVRVANYMEALVEEESVSAQKVVAASVVETLSVRRVTVCVCRSFVRQELLGSQYTEW